MIKPDIDVLGVQQRALLFYLGSSTDWKQAGDKSRWRRASKL